MSHLHLSILIVINLYLNGLLCGVFDKSRLSSSSMVHHPAPATTKIIPTTALPNDQSNNENSQRKRHAKFFPGLSFLTGLGIGSGFAGSMVPSLSNPTLIPSATSIFHSRLPQPIGSSMLMDATQVNAATRSIPQFYDPIYPAYVALSTNAILNQSIRSFYQILQQLKQREDDKEIKSTTTTTTTTVVPTLATENIINESYNEAAPLRINTVDDQITLVNCSALRQVIRDTIREENEYLEQRQAETVSPSGNMRGLLDKKRTTTVAPLNKPDNTQIISNTEMQLIDDPTTTTTTTIAPPSTATLSTTTAVPSMTTTPMPDTTTSWPGYYGGSPQNLTGVNLINGLQYPSTSYGYPNGIIDHPQSPIGLLDHSYIPSLSPTDVNQAIYGPPVYEPGQFHPEYYQYQQPYIDTPADSLQGNVFSTFPENLPITYPQYARARNDRISRVWSNGNGFVPSNIGTRQGKLKVIL